MGKTLGYGEITVANMTEPFTVMLTNEAQQFATDSNRKVTSAQSYYTDIIVIRGSQERTDYTIGNITSGSGITVSKSSKRVTFNVSAGTTIGADTGIIEIPITLDGQTVKKQFSWSCGKQGPQGVKGVDGEKFSWNLIQNGKGNEKRGFFKNFSSVNATEEYGEITLTSKHGYIGIDLPGFVLNPRQYEVGKKVTWSYDIMYTKWDFPTGSNRQEYWMGQRYTSAPSGETATGKWVSVTSHDLPVVGQNGCELNKWFHVEVTKTIPTPASSNVGYQGCINFYNSTDISATVTLRMKNVKLEYGDTATPWSPSQSDLEGRGVSQTVQYYLTTSQASGVTSSTSGWSTDITTQKLTADKKYLWNCYQTKYSDGTSEPISTPKVIGVYGDKGANALQCKRNWTGTYTTINGTTSAALSDFNRTPVAGDVFTTLDGSSNTGTWQVISVSGSNVNIKLLSYVNSRGEKGDNAKNLSITPSSQYFKSTDGGKTFAPNVITIKPTIQGEISFGKWQYSIDGGVSFTDVVSGQKGLTISNNVLTVSKDSSLYSDAVTMVTFRAVASDSSFYDTCSIAKIYDVNDIGDGRNLLLNTSSYRESNPLERTGSNTDDYSTYPKIITSIDLSANQKYTLQAKTDSNWATKHDIGGHTPSEKLVGLWLVSDDTNTFLDMSKGYAIFTAPKTTKYKLRVNQYSNGTDAYTIHLWDIKLEKGQSASGWSAAPEDVQTAILSTKSEISDVSLKVDKNKQAIEQRVEKTTYQQDLNLVKGDISKANEGLNKWRYEIYPKSLFASEYQGKSTMDVFAKNTNLTPSQSVLINDTDLSIAWNYAENYIGYALTFAKFSAAKSVAITFAHDDGAHIYLNGKLIGGSDAYNNNGESLTLGFVKGWNCIEVVVNEGANTEGFKLGTTISVLSECQLMNCYYGTPVARQSHITNQLVQNTTDIKGISTKVSKVTSVIGDNGENFTSFKNEYSDFKQTMNGFKTTVGQTYVTKDDFNGLEIGGRNLLLYSQTIRAHNNYYDVSYLTDEVETFNGCPVWSVKNQWGKLIWLFKSHVIDRRLVKVGDTLTYSLYAKTNNASGKRIACSYRFKGNAQAYWFKDSAFNIGTSWARYSATFTVTKDMLATDTYMNEIGFEETASMSGDDKVYFACPKLERGTKATDYTEAPEDNEVNGQNLVSNLPSSWEQGGINGGQSVGSTYASIKSSTTYRIRIKDIFSVSGNITISAGGTTTNSSKETLSFYGTLYDTKKGLLRETGWKSLPSTINCGDAKYMSIILRWGDGTKTQITPSDISQICLKVERGTSATPFTLAPEDVNGKIVNVETIANQTAKKFSWIVKGESTSSNLVLTDNALTAIANNINLTGKVTFNSFDQSLKDTINNKTNVSYLNFGSGGNKQGFFKIATLQVKLNYVDQNIIFGVNHREHGYTECRIKFSNAGNTDPGMGNFKQTGTPTRAWRIIKTATSTWDLYLAKTDSWDGGRVIKFDNPYGDGVLVTWSGASADLPDGAIIAEQMIADQTTIDGGIITTGYLSADRIAGDSITADKIATDAITADKIVANAITADKIATDAIKSRNYISSGGTQGSFLNLSDGSFTSPNLSWDSNGNLIAKNANLSGEITATEGSIGKFKITDQWLITGSGSTCAGLGGSDQAFWAGAEGSYSAPFRVGYDGKLYANGATISGDITATTGKIGDLTLKDGILTGTGSYSEPYTEDDDGTATSTITTNYITKLFGKGLTIDSTVKYSDEDDVYSYKVSVLPDEISFTDGEEIGMLGAGGLRILQVNDNSDSYSSEANEVSLSSGASNFYYTTPVNQTTDKYLHVCFSADGASFMASQGDKFNSFDIGYSSAKYSGNFAANKFVYTGNPLNYVECLEVNDTTNVYFHSNGYYSFRVNNEGNWSNETQSVYITGHGVSVPGQIGLYSQEMSNYVARYYIAGSTKSTAIGNNSYQTRIYGSSVWANKAVSTSDVRLKQDFQSLDKFEDLYMQLQPVSFKYIDGYDKSEDRYFGLKAQPTEKLFEDMGENPDDYAMFNKFGIDHEDIKERIGYDVDFDEEHGLDYTNLITLNTHMVQKTRRELAELQKENAELKDMLKTIVKKINM